MLSPLVLDYVACVIYAFLLISIVYKRLYNTTENRFFLAVTVISAGAAVMDLCMEASCRTLPI
jgi:hypothetical protein